MKKVRRRAGRPLLEDPRSYRLEVRLNLDEVRGVEEICNRDGFTQADMIRYFIKWARKHSEWVELCKD